MTASGTPGPRLCRRVGLGSGASPPAASPGRTGLVCEGRRRVHSLVRGEKPDSAASAEGGHSDGVRAAVAAICKERVIREYESELPTLRRYFSMILYLAC